MRVLINLFSNVKLGCSRDANLFMYGKRMVKQNKTIEIFNGVDLNKFKRNTGDKSILNKEIIKFITIGRISIQKNSLFLVQVINEIINRKKYRI